MYSTHIVAGFVFTRVLLGVSTAYHAPILSIPLLAFGFVAAASLDGQNGIAFLLGLGLTEVGFMLLQGKSGLSRRIAIAPSTANFFAYILLFILAFISFSGI